jgi:hypothetical protein
VRPRTAAQQYVQQHNGGSRWYVQQHAGQQHAGGATIRCCCKNNYIAQGLNEQQKAAYQELVTCFPLKYNAMLAGPNAADDADGAASAEAEPARAAAEELQAVVDEYMYVNPSR